MAEVAGLTLGTIALAGLFQDCIDIISYIELVRSCEHSVNMAITKTSLLGRRLDRWGQSLAVDRPGEEEQVLRRIWPDENITIIEGLAKVEETLGSAHLLSIQYQAGANSVVDPGGSPNFRPAYCGKPDATSYPPNRPNTSSISRPCSPNAQDPYSGKTISTSPQRNRSNTSVRSQHCSANIFSSWRYDLNSGRALSLGRKLRWAFRDKKKFDGLILDLEFLISSLERFNTVRKPGPQMTDSGYNSTTSEATLGLHAGRDTSAACTKKLPIENSSPTTLSCTKNMDTNSQESAKTVNSVRAGHDFTGIKVKNNKGVMGNQGDRALVDGRSHNFKRAEVEGGHTDIGDLSSDVAINRHNALDRGDSSERASEYVSED